MHIPDLADYQLSSSGEASKLVAVGWLEAGHEFQVGDVDPQLIRKLIELLKNPWEPAVAGGHHACSFCRFSGGPASFRFGKMPSEPEVRIGSSNLWIPADGILYVAPSLILHYMDSHQYSPPMEFQRAVMNCPPMRSTPYLKAILTNGPSGLIPK